MARSAPLSIAATCYSIAASAALAEDLTRALEPRLGFRSEAFVRSHADVQRIAALALPYLDEVPVDGDVNVAFLAQPLTPEQSALVQGLTTAQDRFVLDGSELYWLCNCRQSDSKFSNALFERKVGVRTTLRKASMVGKLLQALDARA